MKKNILIIFLLLIIIIGGAYSVLKLKNTETVQPKITEGIPQEESNDKEIIFGENGGTNYVFSANPGLRNQIIQKFKQNNISLDSWNSNEDEANKNSEDIIENDERFADIKKVINVKYSVYSIDKKLGEFHGKYSIGRFYGAYTNETPGFRVELSDKNTKGLFINGDYNHMPRKVDVYVNANVTDNGNSKDTVTKYKEYDEKSLNKVGKKILGEDRPIEIIQLVKCDLNGDGKQETVVNFNNVFKDKEKLSIEYMEMEPEDWQKYYAVIVVLDEEFNIIDYIQQEPYLNIIIPSHCGMEYTLVNYFNDIDNDNGIEVICRLHGWESWGYKISKFNGDMIYSKEVWYIQ